jgi:hypothetical protein
MDYLDPRKELKNRVLLMVGYVLVAVAIATTALILLQQASGYGVNRKGVVIQNGLTFFSSHPHPANIYVNGTPKSAKTNTRLYLLEGIYSVKLTRSGYYDWQRTINLEGGSVAHFDYPFLFPKDISPKKLQTYDHAPALLTQSPDRRWLLVQTAAALADFEVYDLKNPTKPLSAPLSLPAGLLTKPAASESWQLGEWADDNNHLLLQHIFDGKTEYILVDRGDPTKSLNLTNTLSLKTDLLSLINRKYDRYYLYDQAAKTLKTASLGSPAPAARLEHVLAFKGYGDNSLLYVTDAGTAAGKVAVRLNDGNKTWTVRLLPAGTGYLVDLTKYSGTMYVAAGAASDNRVYIYQDPAGQLDNLPGQAPVPTQVLRVEQANYLSFSDNAQFIVAENGNHFGVYDIENKIGHNYTTTTPIDAPQPHAGWMDGDRLTYVSQGKLAVLDYDNLNYRQLMPAVSGYLPAFAPDYNFVYGLAPAATAGQFELTQTSLLAPADR